MTNTKDGAVISRELIAKAKECGASLVGIANVEELKRSPSHRIYEKLDEYNGVGVVQTDDAKNREIDWPEGARSAIVIAVEHPEERPELDWWKKGFSGGTEGNKILISIAGELSQWMEIEKGIKTWKLPYHVEKGGIFLKDAAVLAGLGCVGKNNMVVTPEYGPRVRLRALLTNTALMSTGPQDFDPCKGCPMPCRKACPQGAFRRKIYAERDMGLSQLPGRNGVYDRFQCNRQMVADRDATDGPPVANGDSGGEGIKYCRLCEFSCPVPRG